ncbi:MAG: LamG-like jellyroll fold domain-containing protein, partial [Catalinimonas sp.]
YDGTAVNPDPTCDRDQDPDGALRFEVGRHVALGEVMDDVFAGAGQQFSFSVWVRPGLTNMANEMIFGKLADGTCGENQRQLYLSIYQNRVNFTWHGSLGLSNYRGVSGSTLVNDPDKWYHITCSYDGTTTGNNGRDRVQMYVDGVLETTSLILSSGAPGDIQNGTAHAGIGTLLTSSGSVCNDGYTFDGRIDDLRIYDRLLTSAEAAALYTPPSATPVVPTVSSFTPAKGVVGTAVTITGSDFTDVEAVFFGNTAATAFTVVSATEITATVPAGAATGAITVRTACDEAGTSADAFAVCPGMVTFSPASLPDATANVGYSQTITQTGFSGSLTWSVTAGSLPPGLLLGTVNGTISGTPTTPGTSNFTVQVEDAGGCTANRAYALTVQATPAPTIISFTPTSGAGGTVVTLTGTDFVNVTGVTFNGVAATFTVNGPGQITTTVPAGATTGDIQVQTDAGSALSPDPFVIDNGPTTYVWNGGADTDWTNPANWSSGEVPGANDVATVAGAATNMPTVATVAPVGGLVVQSGATVSVNGAGTLDLRGNLTNDGTFGCDGGRVRFGGAAAQTVAGTGTTAWSKVRVENPAGVFFAKAVTVCDSLYIGPGARLEVTQTPAVLTLRGHFENRGRFSDLVCNTHFDGTAEQNVTGGGTFVFRRLRVFNPVRVNIRTNITVNDSLVVLGDLSFAGDVEVSLFGDVRNVGTLSTVCTTSKPRIRFRGTAARRFVSIGTTTICRVSVENTAGLTLSDSLDILDSLTIVPTGRLVCAPGARVRHWGHFWNRGYFLGNPNARWWWWLTG